VWPSTWHDFPLPLLPFLSLWKFEIRRQRPESLSPTLLSPSSLKYVSLSRSKLESLSLQIFCNSTDELWTGDLKNKTIFGPSNKRKGFLDVLIYVDLKWYDDDFLCSSLHYDSRSVSDIWRIDLASLWCTVSKSDVCNFVLCAVILTSFEK
jgi:hypothetical protein